MVSFRSCYSPTLCCTALTSLTPPSQARTPPSPVKLAPTSPRTTSPTSARWASPRCL
jgi:hypothetical protein